MGTLRKHYIRFFISSTFDDMKYERDWLANIFHRLGEEYQREKGWIVEYVDLRWGVSLEASRDNKTMSICKAQIAQCQRLSPRPNFIFLLGERYGWVPLPETINPVMGALLYNSDQFFEFYRQDENDISYKNYYNNAPWIVKKLIHACGTSPWSLRPVHEICTDHFEKDSDTLRDLLSRRAKQILKYEKEKSSDLYGSATEKEIIDGVFYATDPQEHVIGYFRKLTDVPIEKQALFKSEKKYESKIKDLEKRLKERLPMEHLLQENLTFEKYNCQEYADHFIQKMEGLIRKMIDEEIERASMDEPTLLQKEVIQQEEYRLSKSYGLFARKEEIERVKGFINTDCAHTLWITGMRGVGKSTLASFIPEIVQELNSASNIQRQVNAFYIRCGLTSVSQIAIRIVNVLHAMVFSCYNNSEKIHPRLTTPILLESDNADYDGTSTGIYKQHYHYIKYLFDDIAKHYDDRVVVIIDGIDSLSSKEQEKLFTIPWMSPNAAFIKFVFTTDHLDADFNPSDGIEIMHLEPFDPVEGKMIIKNILENKDRTLTHPQEQKVSQWLNATHYTGTSLELMGYFLTHFVYSWTIAENLPCPNEDILLKIINTIIKDQYHNEDFVWRVLTLIALTHGINDSELIEILALDHELHDIMMGPTEKKLSPIFWYRLSHDIGELVNYYSAPYGETNQFQNVDIKDRVIEYAHKRNVGKTTLYQRVVELQYNYYKSRWIKENMRALYDMPNFILSYYGEDSIEGLRELLRLAFDLRYTSRVTEHYGHHIGLLFDIILNHPAGLGQAFIEAQDRTILQQIRNWLFARSGMGHEQIMLQSLNEADDSPIRRCYIDGSICEDSLTNLFRNTIGKDSVLYYPDEDFSPIGMSQDSMRVLYIKQYNIAKNHQELIYINRANWKKSIIILPGKISHICVDETITRVAVLFSDNSVKVYSIDDRNVIIGFSGGSKIDCISISPDGNLVAISLEKQYCIWSIDENQWIYNENTDEKISSLLFSNTSNSLWLVNRPHITLFVINQNVVWSWEMSDLLSKEIDSRLLAATDRQCLIDQPWGPIHLRIKENDDMSIYRPKQLSRSMGSSRDIYAAFNDRGELFASSDDLLWQIQRDIVTQPDNVATMFMISRDLKYGLGFDGIVYDIRICINNYQIETQSISGGLINVGLSSMSSSNDGTWVLCSGGRDLLRQKDFHIASVIIDENHIAHSRVGVPPYTDDGIYATISSSISPDGRLCALSSFDADSLHLLLMDRDFNRDRYLFLPKAVLNEKNPHTKEEHEDSDEYLGAAYWNAIRAFIWSQDSSYIIGATWHDISDSHPHLHLFNRNGDYLKSILSSELGLGYTTLFSPNNRYAVRISYDVSYVDLETGEQALYEIPYNNDVINNFLMHPSGRYAFINIELNLFVFNYTHNRIESKKVIDSVGTLLAISPSGRYLYSRGDGKQLYLMRIDLADLTKKFYPWNAEDVVCTLNDDYFYVRLDNDDILLVQSHSADVMARTNTSVVSMISTGSGLAVADKHGKLFMLTPKESIHRKINQYGNTTAIRCWRHEKHQWNDRPSAVCPYCGQLLEVPDAILQRLQYDFSPTHYNVQAAGEDYLCCHCQKCNKSIIYNYYLG